MASVIIGEVVFGTRSLMRRLVAVTLGAMLYRMIIAVALEMGMPATDLKLVSATLVALALAMPVIRKKAGYYKRKMTAQGFGQGGK